MALSSSLNTSQRKLLKDASQSPLPDPLPAIKNRALNFAVSNKVTPTPTRSLALPPQATASVPPATNFQTSTLPTADVASPSSLTGLIKDALQQRISAAGGGLQPLIGQALTNVVNGPDISQITGGTPTNLDTLRNIYNDAQQSQVERAQGLLGLQATLGDRFDKALEAQQNILQEKNAQKQQELDNAYRDKGLALQQAALNRELNNDQYQQNKDALDYNYRSQQDKISNDLSLKTFQLNAVKDAKVDPWTGEILPEYQKFLTDNGINVASFSDTQSNPNYGKPNVSRTDRTNNPIAASVSVGGDNSPIQTDPYNREWLNTLDNAGVKYTIEKGHNFGGNRATIAFATPADGIRGAIALLGTSAFGWYKKHTGAQALADVATANAFRQLPLVRQVDAVLGTYVNERGTTVKDMMKSFMARAAAGVIQGVDISGKKAIQQGMQSAPPVQITPNGNVDNTAPVIDPFNIITQFATAGQNVPQDYLQPLMQDWIKQRIAEGSSEKQAILEWTSKSADAVAAGATIATNQKNQQDLAQKTLEAQNEASSKQQVAMDTLNKLALSAPTDANSSIQFMKAYMQAVNPKGGIPTDTEAESAVRNYQTLGGLKAWGLNATQPLTPDIISSLLASLDQGSSNKVKVIRLSDGQLGMLPSNKFDPSLYKLAQ